MGDAEDFGLVRVTDKDRVERLAMGLQPVEGVEIAFQQVGPCAHLGKDHEIVEPWGHVILPYEIGFAGG